MPRPGHTRARRSWIASVGVAVFVAVLAPSALAGGEIENLNPNFAVRDAPQAVVTVKGKFPNKNVNPRVFVGNKKLPTSVLVTGPKNAKQLQTTIPAGRLRGVGPRNLSVHDCKAGVCTNPSPTKRFHVYGVTSISPAQAAGGEGFEVRVDGRFPKAVRMAVGGRRTGDPTIHVDGVPLPTQIQATAAGGIPKSLTASVPGSIVTRIGSAEVDVRLCHAGDCFVTLNSLPLFLTAKGAVLNDINPEKIVVGSQQLVVGVRGSGFVPGAAARVDGIARPTSFVSSDFLSLTIPAADLATPGIRQITVASPNGALSSALPLQVLSPDSIKGPVPIVKGADASKGDAGSELTIGGTGFGTGQDASTGQVTFGGISVGEASGWRSQRIKIKVPDLPAGTYPVQLVSNGIAAPVGRYTINPIKKARPIANPVLLPGGGGQVLFDASLSLDPNSGVPVGDAGIRASAVGLSGIVSVLWEYGDGTSSRGPQASKTYTRPGNYPVTLTVTDSDGQKSTSRQVVRVTGTPGALRAAVPPANISLPSRVVFDYGSHELRPESQQVLLKLADLVRTAGRRATVGGHTDSVGSSAFNQKLSQDRARAVRRFLVTKGGVSPLLLSAVGFGETAPISTNATALGRQHNRRVTLSIIRSNSPVKLTGRQLQIDQRLAIAALLREKALRKRLTAGLKASDLKNGSLHADSFDGSVVVAGSELLNKAPSVRPRPIVVPRLGKAKPGFKFTARQVLINRRISQVAVARANALAERIDDGLTGGDIADGAITPAKLVPGLRFGSIGDGPGQRRVSFSVPKLAKGNIPPATVTEADLIANQRRSQAAIRRLNLLISRVNEGFSAEDFQPGSLAGSDIAR